MLSEKWPKDGGFLPKMLALQVTGAWAVLLRTLPLQIPGQELHQVIS